MLVWITSIITGIEMYKEIAVVALLVTAAIAVWATKKVNLVRGFLAQAFVFYICCVIGLVFFPMPTATQAANLTYTIQLMPCHWILDLIKEPAFRTVANVYLNIIMTIPFGVFLRYLFKFDKKTVILCSFALSFVIELGQLTGFFFLFDGSYRLCDVDDLITNTLGGYLGFLIMSKLENMIPACKSFDILVAPKVLVSQKN